MRSILNEIIKNTMGFIRSSNQVKPKLHLVKWDVSASLVENGEWDLKNMFKLSLALMARSLWLEITGDSLWTRFIQVKFFKRISLVQWIRSRNKR